MIDSSSFINVSNIIQIGSILLVASTALVYFVSQLKIGSSTARSNIIKDLNLELEIKSKKVIELEHEKEELLKLVDHLRKESDTQTKKITEYKKIFERRDPELISLLHANHDVLLQVEKVLGGDKDGSS